MQQYNSGDLIAFCDAEDVELIEYIKNNNLNGRKLEVMGESDLPRYHQNSSALLT